MTQVEQEDKKLNLFKLKRLIDSGIEAIPVDKKFKSAVLVIGDTGVGKTTILSFLAKRKLYIKIHGLNTILDSDEQDGLKIGHDRFSETRVPAKIIIDHMVFFDCSGFKDNRGEQFEISNSFFVQRLFDIYQNIKILLIIDESSVSEVRADKLPKLLRNLLKSFNTLTDIQEGVILLINRAKPEYSEKVYGEQLLKLAKLKNEGGYLFNEEERNFLQYLVKNRKVCLFKQAQKEDEGKLLNIKEQNLLNLIKDTHYVKSKKIKNIISESAKLCIRDFIDRVAVDSEEKIQRLSQEIIKQFSYETRNLSDNEIEAAKETKKRIVKFAQSIEKIPDEQILQLIQSNVNNVDLSAFEQDVSTVLFFKNIYNKADFFFKLVRSNLASSLSKLILNLDTEIAHLQEQEKKYRELREQNQAAQKLAKSLSEEIAQIRAKYEQEEKLLKQSNVVQAQQLTDFQSRVRSKDDEVHKLKEQLKSANEAYSKYQQEANKKLEEQQKAQEKADKQLAELTEALKSLKLEAESKAQEIDMLQIENASLKHELENVNSIILSGQKSESQSLLNDSKISKSSKYPDVICPHFKNGGQCVHCIKAWKAEQRQRKKEQKLL